MYPNAPPHMAEQKQDDQLEQTYSSYVGIQDVALKTCQRRWTIGRSGGIPLNIETKSIQPLLKEIAFTVGSFLYSFLLLSLKGFLFLHTVQYHPFGWGFTIHWLHLCKIPTSNKCSGYSTKPSHGEPLALELWGNIEYPYYAHSDPEWYYLLPSHL